MFTSRAEYRLLLREDNADIRLTPIGRSLGLISDERWAFFENKMEQIEKEKSRLRDTWASPNNSYAEKLNPALNSPLVKEQNLEEILRRPEMTFTKLMHATGLKPIATTEQAQKQVEIQVKYQGYIENELDEIQKQLRNEETYLPANFDYSGIPGLSTEIVMKLNDFQPETIGKASRISGVTPAAISILLIHLKRMGLLGVKDNG
jgi:tRNA uridine 5-carboxymethylaminomethyl modification enzyme